MALDEGYPWLGGTHAQVSTSAVEFNDHLLEKFSTPDAEPHIAISVDLLDTGIDMPEVVNLVSSWCASTPTRRRTACCGCACQVAILQVTRPVRASLS